MAGIILPKQIQDVVRELWKRNKHLSSGSSTDEKRRSLTKMIVEQVVYLFGNNYGWKTAGEGRPPSKDSLARKEEDGRLISWDLFLGTTQEPITDPVSEDITDQIFISVTPVNHLGSTIPSPKVPPSNPIPTNNELARLRQEIADLRKELVETNHKILVLSGPRRVGIQSNEGKYLCEDKNLPRFEDGSFPLRANREKLGSWEQFWLMPVDLL